MGKKSRKNKGKNQPKPQAENNASIAAVLGAVKSNLSSLDLEDNSNANNKEAAADTSATETTAGSDSPSGTKRCYHGCHPDQTNLKSFFHRVLDEYIHVRSVKFRYENFGEGTLKEFNEANLNFYMRYGATVLADPKFVRFVFAFCTEMYLTSGFPDDITKENLNGNIKKVVMEKLIYVETVRLGLKLRYGIHSQMRGEDFSEGSELDVKLRKYFRDSDFERGYVNILAREIPCNCMDASKARFSASGKTGLCHGCGHEFPKHKLLDCKCRTAVYCSRACQVKHWPQHKVMCKMGTTGRVPEKYNWAAPIRDYRDK